jgi:hypothetical protein
VNLSVSHLIPCAATKSYEVDKQGSHEIDTCAPNPICQDVATDFRGSLDRVQADGKNYTADVELYDWVGTCYNATGVSVV